MTAMGDGNSEPSMEHILSSIKRIIAEDGETQLAERRERRPRIAMPAADPVGPPDGGDEPDVLELSDAMSQQRADGAAQDNGTPEEPASPSRLLSDGAAAASRSSLDQLSQLVVKPDVAGSDTLEGLVREMLRPMLSEWLDENLPRVVDAMVAREIARITGR